MLKPFTTFILVHSILPFFVMPAWGLDSYEDDDQYGTANVFVIGSESAENEAVQHHTFHETDDADWVVFYALAGTGYAIRTFNIDYDIPTGKFADTYIELYDTDGTTIVKSANFPGVPGHDDRLDWTCDKTGVYYVKIKKAPQALFVNEAGYDLVIFYTDIFYLPDYLTGTVKSSSGQPVSHAMIQASGSEMNGTTLSTTYGSFILSLKGGTYTIFVSAEGYLPKIISSVSVPGNSLTISLSPANTPPAAAADNFTVTKGGSVAGNVLLNDSDADGDPLQAVLDRNVSLGTLSFKSDGSFTYNHNGENFPADSFTYHVNDGSTNSNTVTVTIRVDLSRTVVAPVLLLLK